MQGIFDITARTVLALGSTADSLEASCLADLEEIETSFCPSEIAAKLLKLLPIF